MSLNRDHEIHGSSPTRLVAAAVALLLALGIALISPAPARAGHYQPCEEKQISDAVKEVTGNIAIGGVCNASLYGGTWDSYSQLRDRVSTLMYSCSGGIRQLSSMNLVQAVVELNGEPPRGSVCSKQIYQDIIDSQCTSGCSTIDWTIYKETDDGGAGAPPGDVDAGYLKKSAWAGTQQALHYCFPLNTTQALIERTGRIPERRSSEWDPLGANSQGPQFDGQCNPDLYRSVYTSYNGLLYDIIARAESTTDCGISTQANEIDQAFDELTGWNPKPGECDPSRYKAGNWSSYAELKRRVAASFRCDDPWIGQVYVMELGRTARGRGRSGECNPSLYGNGSWSSYGDLASKMGVSKQKLEDAGWKFKIDGSVRVADGSGNFLRELEPNDIGVVNAAGIISTGGGNLIGHAGGNIISTGGGNISLGGGSLIGEGGLGLLSEQGAGLISENGLGIIATGGGNIIAAGGGN